jgi:hypothetical protein
MEGMQGGKTAPPTNSGDATSKPTPESAAMPWPSPFRAMLNYRAAIAAAERMAQRNYPSRRHVWEPPSMRHTSTAARQGVRASSDNAAMEGDSDPFDTE